MSGCFFLKHGVVTSSSAVADKPVRRAASRLTAEPVAKYGCESNVAAWHSGNGVGCINEVTLRRARLVLGWVTCLGSTPSGNTLFRYVTSHPGRLSLLPSVGR